MEDMKNFSRQLERMQESQIKLLEVKTKVTEMPNRRF